MGHATLGASESRRVLTPLRTRSRTRTRTRAAGAHPRWNPRVPCDTGSAGRGEAHSDDSFSSSDRAVPHRLLEHPSARLEAGRQSFYAMDRKEFAVIAR